MTAYQNCKVGDARQVKMDSGEVGWATLQHPQREPSAHCRAVVCDTGRRRAGTGRGGEGGRKGR